MYQHFINHPMLPIRWISTFTEQSISIVNKDMPMEPISIKTLDELKQYDLYSHIQAAFKKAESNGDLIYKKSQSEIHKDPDTDMTYELTIVEGLSKRPINRPTQPGSEDTQITDEKLDSVKSKNPFMKPELELTIIDDLLNDYRLVLNKFPNQEEHFLLVTKDFVQQDSLLKPLELQIMQIILLNVNSKLSETTNNSKFFAFFNSGPESGYSQFHKHIQFMKLPVNFQVYQSNLVSNTEFFLPTGTSTSKSALLNKKFTFKHYLLKIKTDFENFDEQEQMLAMIYMFLFRTILNVFKEHEIDLSLVSYNFMMMEDWCMIVPRRKAFYLDIWQNSLGFMGLFNAKNVDVKNEILKVGVGKILQECGFALEEDEDKIIYNEYGY